MLELLALVALAVITAVALGVLLMRLVRLSELRRWSKPDTELVDIALQLFRHVDSETDDKNLPVDITSFWRGRGLTPADKYSVVMSLVRGRDLRLPRASLDGFEALFRDMYQWAAVPVPRVVTLSPRQYDRLTSEIIVERMRIVLTEQRQEIVNTGFIGSVHQAGRDANNTTDDVTMSPQVVTPELVGMLAAALREDAARLKPDQRSPILNLADQVERAEKNSDDGAIKSLVKKATEYTTLMSGALRATSEVLKGFKDLF